MAIQADEKCGDKPILKDGATYGLQGEAKLTTVSARKVLNKGEPTGDYYLNLGVEVDDPQQGKVFLNTGPYGKFNTQLGAGAGSKARIFLANLGLDPNMAFDDEAEDEFGNSPPIGPELPLPMQVVVVPSVREGKDGNVYMNIADIKSLT